MCGIAGIVGRLSEPNRAALKRMNDAMVHRGPDGEGFWEAPPDENGWGAMFAHRRLSILDLSPMGAQPMVDAETGHVVVLNGEIYNYVELRDQLAAAGQYVRSTGDTAVMLRTMSVNGPGAVGTLRGMFAFAIWDPAGRKLTMARDPLGIKPLYLARNSDSRGDWSLVFASEVRAILASGLLGQPRLNPAAAASVAWNGFMVTPQSAILNIESVCPGELRTFDGKGKQEGSKRYWSAQRHCEAAPPDEAGLTCAIEECVHLHMASDVPLGVFLSGGVDSSSVANLAQKSSRETIHTFTLAFEEQEYNEGPIARQIAEAIGTRHQEILLTEQQFIAQLEDALDSLDQPTFDGINSFYMSRAVRDAGFKVALAGTGGDELFGGYTSFRDLPLLLRGAKRSKWIPAEVRLALAKLVSSTIQPPGATIPQQTRWAKLPAMIQCRDDLLSLYQVAYALFLPDFQKQLLGSRIVDSLEYGLPATMRAQLQGEVQGRTPLSAISVMELRLFLGERLLRDTDSTSMSASLEIRLPLVDKVLFERVDRLCDNERYQPLKKKSLLRTIGLQGLDPRLFDRPKSGFVLPYDRWIRTGLGKVMDQTMRDPQAVNSTGLDANAVGRLWQAFLEGAPGLYWSRIWAIYVFVRWCHQHRVCI